MAGRLGIEKMKIMRMDDENIHDWHWDYWWRLFDVRCKLCASCGDSRVHFKRKINSSAYCNSCKKSRSPYTGTIFQNTKLLIPIWSAAYYFHVKLKLKHEDLKDAIGVSYVTASNIRRRLNSIKSGSIEEELLETYLKEFDFEEYYKNL